MHFTGNELKVLCECLNEMISKEYIYVYIYIYIYIYILVDGYSKLTLRACFCLVTSCILIDQTDVKLYLI